MSITRHGSVLQAWSGYNQATHVHNFNASGGSYDNATLLLVFVTGNWNTGPTLNNATWNGTSMTIEEHRTYSNYGLLLSLENPDIGNYNMILYYSTGVNWFRSSACFLSGIDTVTGWKIESNLSIGGNASVTPEKISDMVIAGGQNRDANPTVSGGDLTAWLNGNNISVGYAEGGTSAVTCAFANDANSIGIAVRAAVPSFIGGRDSSAIAIF
jgi:hypothetical protein